MAQLSPSLCSLFIVVAFRPKPRLPTDIMVFFMVRLEIILICSLRVENILASSSGNLSWTEYHPLEHHQAYLQYLQENYPQFAEVRLILNEMFC